MQSCQCKMKLPQTQRVVLDQLSLETFTSRRFSLGLAMTSAITDSPPGLLKVSELRTSACFPLQGPHEANLALSFFSLDIPWSLPRLHGLSKLCFPSWLIKQVLLNRKQGKYCSGNCNSCTIHYVEMKFDLCLKKKKCIWVN